jgi:hypothetical protein
MEMSWWRNNQQRLIRPWSLYWPILVQKHSSTEIGRKADGVGDVFSGCDGLSGVWGVSLPGYCRFAS